MQTERSDRKKGETRPTSFCCHFYGCQSVQTKISVCCAVVRLARWRDEKVSIVSQHLTGDVSPCENPCWLILVAPDIQVYNFQDFFFFFHLAALMPFSVFVMLRCDGPVYLSWNSFALLRDDDPDLIGNEHKSNRCLHFSRVLPNRVRKLIFFHFLRRCSCCRNANVLPADS